jgi:hypothetical protein
VKKYKRKRMAIVGVCFPKSKLKLERTRQAANKKSGMGKTLNEDKMLANELNIFSAVFV